MYIYSILCYIYMCVLERHIVSVNVMLYFLVLYKAAWDFRNFI